MITLRPTTGSKSPNAKLTESNVIEIRNSDLTYKELAKLYGVCYGTIAKIKMGTRWTHI